DAVGIGREIDVIDADGSIIGVVRRAVGRCGGSLRGASPQEGHANGGGNAAPQTCRPRHGRLPQGKGTSLVPDASKNSPLAPKVAIPRSQNPKRLGRFVEVVSEERSSKIFGHRSNWHAVCAPV